MLVTLAGLHCQRILVYLYEASSIVVVLLGHHRADQVLGSFVPGLDDRKSLAQGRASPFDDLAGFWESYFLNSDHIVAILDWLFLLNDKIRNAEQILAYLLLGRIVVECLEERLESDQVDGLIILD